MLLIPNQQLRLLLGWHLQQAGYRVTLLGELAQGYTVTGVGVLLVLDLDWPQTWDEGLQLAVWFSRQPLGLMLMISARNQETDIVAGLQAGADDYLVKPFGLAQFVARVQALARRWQKGQTVLQSGALTLDLLARRGFCQGQELPLTPHEFHLLALLTQAQGEVVSRQMLQEQVWGATAGRTLDTHILGLRKKLPPALQITTVHRLGYRLVVTPATRRC
ncbi:winged helix family two component transcriptional regulator [Gloeomargarita lithophora Alchichica-D10]|uniref:Winged helix family two component transcriptional regulator n=1 Tax=Gloeomargarita lithophora Alchichica-D10 TaxID=1188229 RepID=A0A1J0AC37_9CYAN|nr:response regulator transcription factor [Gloeomargarita lithophora]APB33491.1 winged helix family two component transcriptional regulator [Gloeomargarita lithophora Alchichica-D10]